MTVSFESDDNVPIIVIKNSIQYAAALTMIEMLWLSQPSAANEAMIIATENAVTCYEELLRTEIDSDGALEGVESKRPARIQTGNTLPSLLSSAMESTAALFTHVTGGALVNDGAHFVLIFTDPSGKEVQIAMPMASLDGLKQVVDDLKLLRSGTPTGNVKQ